jgi:ABC-type transporter Mla MlaB component
MLRLNVHETPRKITFQLEGKLLGPWLKELEECWRRTLTGTGMPIVSVDLTGLTYVDAAGKACLTTMYRHGAEFTAPDCLTKEIVDEIRRCAVEPPTPPSNSQSPRRGRD